MYRASKAGESPCFAFGPDFDGQHIPLPLQELTARFGGFYILTVTGYSPALSALAYLLARWSCCIFFFLSAFILVCVIWLPPFVAISDSNMYQIACVECAESTGLRTGCRSWYTP